MRWRGWAIALGALTVVCAAARWAAPRSVRSTPPTPRASIATATSYSPEPDAPLAEVASRAGLEWPPPDVRIIVRKADHVLEAWSGENLLKTYPAAFGNLKGEPVFDKGPKRREGDRLTPEGAYYICTRNGKSPYRLFLGISYPNVADAQLGLDEGAITQSQYDAICQANAAGQCPPWNTRLGGEIGIHGGGYGSEWTWGCIAMSDEAVEELWGVCALGTPVEIVR